MKKIGIIGRTAFGKDLYDGQTVLTRIFKEELEKQFNNYKFIIVDTYNYKKNILKCFFKTIYSLFTCEYIFILLSRNGLSFYLPFIYYFNKITRKKIIHRVIGGNLNVLISKNPKWIKYLNSFKYNYVETKSLSNSLKNLGLTNVKVSPNFKPLKQISNIEIKKYNNKECFRFCTFSRVIKEKGITDAINAIVKVKEKGQNVSLDIYGPIEDKYKEEFDMLVNKYKFINYKGIIDYKKSVEVLKEYFMLLFPTYWRGEGFPGTFIDCFASGLPIIATNWNQNSEIIKDKVTGIIYERDDLNNNLIDAINFSIKNYREINKMKENCLNEYKNYNPSNIVGKIKKDII